jgi:ATP-dependent RNA helicase DeaD
MSAFASTGLAVTEILTRGLARHGIAEPTAVQEAAIPAVLAGQDLIIQSGTGTGKTLAYVLALLDRAHRDPQFRVVIMAPSPELALQILRTVEAYKSPSLKSASLVGSGNIARQKERLKEHPQVLVGTPGRVLEMIFARKVQTRTIKALVLDEVDQILTDQNAAELDEICSRPEFDSQIITASATFGRRAEAFAQSRMKPERRRLQLAASPLRENIAHRFVVFPGDRAELPLVRLFAELEIDRALVFVHKSYNVAKLFHALNAHDIPCVTLSAERTKGERGKALAAIRAGAARALVATDAAARGLDIEGLAWVIHYELANNNESYLHRSGRTGRAGKIGTSIVMVTKEELPVLERLARELKLDFTPLAEAQPRR